VGQRNQQKGSGAEQAATKSEKGATQRSGEPHNWGNTRQGAEQAAKKIVLERRSAWGSHKTGATHARGRTAESASALGVSHITGATHTRGGGKQNNQPTRANKAGRVT
jgi:hypothetical protein